MNVTTTHINITTTHINITTTHINITTTHINITATHINITTTHINITTIHIKKQQFFRVSCDTCHSFATTQGSEQPSLKNTGLKQLLSLY